MREPGIAANATPRFVRGRSKGKMRDAIYLAQRRGASTAVRQRVTDVAEQLAHISSSRDPARDRLLETRRVIFHGWLNVAEALDLQGEAALASEVRQFAAHRPRVLTDKERVAIALVQHLEQNALRDAVRKDTRFQTKKFTR